MRSMKDSLMKEYSAIEQRLTEAIKNIPIESLNQLLPFSSILLNRICFLYILSKKGAFLPEKQNKEDFIKQLAAEPRLLLNLDQIPEKERGKYFSPDFQKVPQLFCALTDDPILQDVNFDTFDIDSTFWQELALFLEDSNFDLLSLNSNSFMVGDLRIFSPTNFLLGDLFETQCNQRETGSYYTPKEVASYMVNLSLDYWLCDQIRTKFNKEIPSFERYLLERNNQPNIDYPILRYCYEGLLKNLKICDNACGGGVFLITVLEKLYWYYHHLIKILRIQPSFNTEMSIIKHFSSEEQYILNYILKNNIYGIDAQIGATEATRFSLFLLYIASMNKKSEFFWIDLNNQILCGNSLIGFIFLPRTEPILPRTQDLQYWIKSTSSINKKVDLFPDTMERRDHFFEDLYRKWCSHNQIVSSNQEKERFRRLITQFKPFHWEIELPSIINQGGFDLIIGNPPYLSFSSSKSKKNFAQKDILDLIYGKLDDLYEAFVIRAKHLSKGQVCYLVPTSFYKQVGEKIVKNLINYENLGEKIFPGANTTVAIIHYDNKTHSTFKIRSYLFYPNKLNLLGQPEARSVSDFNFYRELPIIQYLDKNHKKFQDYGLKVKRGEEFGRKMIRNERNPHLVPIYTAEELEPFTLSKPSYYTDPKQFEKDFYANERIGVNLAFRSQFKAAYIGKAYTLKSIISIYGLKTGHLFEILALLNSQLFDWYHRQKYCYYTELRLNTIAEIRNGYPLQISDSKSLQSIVFCHILQRSPVLLDLINIMILLIYLEGKLENTLCAQMKKKIEAQLLMNELLFDESEFDRWKLIQIRSLAEEELTHEELTYLIILKQQVQSRTRNLEEWFHKDEIWNAYLKSLYSVEIIKGMK